MHTLALEEIMLDLVLQNDINFFKCNLVLYHLSGISEALTLTDF